MFLGGIGYQKGQLKAIIAAPAVSCCPAAGARCRCMRTSPLQPHGHPVPPLLPAPPSLLSCPSPTPRPPQKCYVYQVAAQLIAAKINKQKGAHSGGVDPIDAWIDAANAYITRVTCAGMPTPCTVGSPLVDTSSPPKALIVSPSAKCGASTVTTCTSPCNAPPALPTGPCIVAALDTYNRGTQVCGQPPHCLA